MYKIVFKHPPQARRLLWATIGFIVALGALSAHEKDSASAFTLQQLWELTLKEGPELTMIQAQSAKRRAETLQQGQLLPSNPEIEISATNGSRQMAPYYDPNNPSQLLYHQKSQRSSGGEVGISQEIEIGGQRGLRRKIAKLSRQTDELLLRQRSYELRSLLREEYYRYSLSSEMSDHIQEHVDTIRFIRGRFGTNYQDPKLGNYVVTVIAVDQARIESEKSVTDTERLRAQMALRRITGIDSATPIAVPNVESIPLPSIPSCDEIAKSAVEMRPDLQTAQKEAEIKELNARLATRQLVPNITLFAYAGKGTIGSGGETPEILTPTSENENYVRAGIRFPLPIFNRNQAQRVGNRADSTVQKMQLQILQNQSDQEIRAYCEQYKNLKRLSDKLQTSGTQEHRYLNQLSSALLNRRIAYFEFLTELEKWHEYKIKHHANLIQAIQLLGQLEMMSGSTLGDLAMPEESQTNN